MSDYKGGVPAVAAFLAFLREAIFTGLADTLRATAVRPKGGEAITRGKISIDFVAKICLQCQFPLISESFLPPLFYDTIGKRVDDTELDTPANDAYFGRLKGDRGTVLLCSSV